MGQRRTFADELRGAIETDERTNYQISKDSGVDEATISKFTRGQVGLSLGSIDKLWLTLRLSIKQARRQRKKGRQDR